jgi:hypothetical protein
MHIAHVARVSFFHRPRPDRYTSYDYHIVK